MHATSSLEEADRLMTVCNSCRYCEGLCAVFPAMEMRRSFSDGDLNYLANLCHSCGACYVDCQFAPPHEFAVNVPLVLEKVRNDSYAAYTWPSALRGLFERNGLAIGIVTALSVALFIGGFVTTNDPAAVFGPHAGDFYKLMPHNAMVLVFGGVFGYALLALGLGLRRFWRDVEEPVSTLKAPKPIWHALKDAGRLRYLDGGGDGCFNEGDKPSNSRRLYHHFTFYGFMLCAASTSVATGYHYLLHREAPYAVYDLPVILGIAGGLGLMVGTVGLMRAKAIRDPSLVDQSRKGMDTGFLVMLFSTAGSGMVLLIFRDSQAMGMLLAAHLGIVFSLFFMMPYGKFVHGLYRVAALIIHARERSMLND